MARYDDDDNISYSGRPPKDPMERIGTPVRALVTPMVVEALIKDMHSTGLLTKREGVVSSDIVRLAIFERLQKVGLMDDELYTDPSWDTLKMKGLV